MRPTLRRLRGDDEKAPILAPLLSLPRRQRFRCAAGRCRAIVVVIDGMGTQMKLKALPGLMLLGAWACGPKAHPVQQDNRVVPVADNAGMRDPMPVLPAAIQPQTTDLETSSSQEECAGCAFRPILYGQACSGIDVNEVGMLCSRQLGKPTAVGPPSLRANVQACKPDCCTYTNPPHRSAKGGCEDCNYASVVYSHACTPDVATHDEVLLCAHAANHVMRPITNRGVQFRSRVRPCTQSCCADLTSRHGSP